MGAGNLNSVPLAYIANPLFIEPVPQARNSKKKKKKRFAGCPFNLMVSALERSSAIQYCKGSDCCAGELGRLGEGSFLGERC